MKIIEKLLWILFLLLIILNTLVNINFIFIFLNGLLLSIFYFYFTFFILNDIKVVSIFKASTYKAFGVGKILTSIAFGFSYSITCFTITFFVLRWPGTAIFLPLSILVMIIILISIYKYRNIIERAFFINVKNRTLLILILVLIMFIISLLPVAIKEQILPAENKYENIEN